MRGIRPLLLFLLLWLPAAAQNFTVATLSRHLLTNEGVIMLAKAGFDELFIIERIQTSRTRFDTTPEGMVALKQAGVSEDLIRVMAIQDARTYPAYTASGAPLLPAAPAANTERNQVIVDKHWWGFHWVTVTR
jgi:hypothetical protein